MVRAPYCPPAFLLFSNGGEGKGALGTHNNNYMNEWLQALSPCGILEDRQSTVYYMYILLLFHCSQCTYIFPIATPSPNNCLSPLTDTTDCGSVSCDCPSLPYACPEDSVLVEVRQSDCCVTLECTCPNITCPHLMECGQGVQPIPTYRGNSFPGRCCPNYNFAGT